MRQKRWQVEIPQITGDRVLLESTLAAVGFELVGDRLVSDQFESLNDPGDVRAIINNVRRKIDEISELKPDLKMGFKIGSVCENSPDGVKRIHDVVEIGESVVMKLVGYPPTVLNTSLTEEERLEQVRRAEVEYASKLLHSALVDDKVLEVMRLANGQASYTDIYKAYEIIRDDVGKRLLLQIASKEEWKRYTGNLNHPNASGDDARHARLNNPPPNDPMAKGEVYAFTVKIVDWWVDLKNQS